MDTREAYLFYEAGQAVAAAHLGLRLRRVSGNPDDGAIDVAIPKDNPKAQMILWLTGIAAERKAMGRSHPLRRMRNRVRVRQLAEQTAARMAKSKARQASARRALLSQSQDRANAICGQLFSAIEQIAARLRTGESLSGTQVAAIVKAAKRGEA